MNKKVYFYIFLFLFFILNIVIITNVKKYIEILSFNRINYWIDLVWSI